MKKGLECHFAAYGCLEVIESDQGTHFMGRQVQQWLQELMLPGGSIPHITCLHREAGIIESYKGLLKRGSKLESGSLHGWSQRLWTVLRQFNERLLMGAVAPIDALLKHSSAPIQLQVQTTHESLKPGFGTQNNILLLAPQAIQLVIPRGGHGHGPSVSQTGSGSTWLPLREQALM